MAFKLKVYCAQKMTGRYCDEMVKEARKIKRLFEKHGLEVVSPVLEEKIPCVHRKLDYVAKERLLEEWALDKKVRLRRCHVLYDANADLSSEGVAVERGIARWYQWAGVVRRKLKHLFSISTIEDDQIVRSHEQAALFMKKKWGTRAKWVRWKLPHILFGIPKHVAIQVKSLWL